MVGDQFTEQDMVEALQCSDIDAEAALDYLLKKGYYKLSYSNIK